MGPDEDVIRKAFESSPVGFMIIKLDDTKDPGLFRQIMANESAARITGIEMKSNNDQLWKHAYPQLIDSKLTEIILEVASNDTQKQCEIKFEDTVNSTRRFGCWAWNVSRLLVVLAFDCKNTMEQLPVKERESQENKALESKFVSQEAELLSTVKELEAFTYSVSHDLRAPLRRLDGFSQELLNEYGEVLDETGKHYLKRVRAAAQKMGDLIDDLLKLSRISRSGIQKDTFDLGVMASEIVTEQREWEPERKVEFHTEGNLKIEADSGLIRLLMQNLISNAWKFTAGCKLAHIVVGSKALNGLKTYYVKDNGVGFDMKYADKLFRAFQRLHSEKQFEGSGIGLATVQRIINRHGGTVWAESEPGEGAIFLFHLNQKYGEE